MDLFLNLIRGFSMALADSVPGVSGGTIAFVLGFYDEFIGSLYVLTHGTFGKLKTTCHGFLGEIRNWLGSWHGIIRHGFGKSFLQPGSMNSVPLFLGLSLFSLPLILKEEKQALSQKNRLPFFLLGLFVVFVITWFNPAGGKGVQVDVAQLTPTLGLYIFVCAMIAICAMVLPGISGSTMLLIFGLYVPIIGAIREFLHMNPFLPSRPYHFWLRRPYRDCRHHPYCEKRTGNASSRHGLLYLGTHGRFPLHHRYGPHHP